ncbi:MAG TPA: Gfo/Idh/MocA family oxidoreductase, partial [Pyrinomonadaceae bacterium]|nr:Gfo/Idh/MocA family oxidoreductase [Pyrinomonadaceae bacterium]
LGAIGSHTIDSLNWFLGTEISQVFCQLQTHVKKRKDEKTGEMREVTTDDEANLIVRFADGDLLKDATGTIAISMVEHGAYQNRMEFFGADGTIRIDSRGELFIAKAGDKDWKPIEVKLGKSPKGVFDSGFPSGFMAFAPKIIEAIRNGETEIEHAATFEDGLKVQKVIDAAHESNEKNCVVKI